MYSQFNLGKKVDKFLREKPDEFFTNFEIAKSIVNNSDYSKDCEAKMNASNVINTKDELIKQIQAEIASFAIRRNIQRKNPKIKTTDDKPKRWYYSSKDYSDEKFDFSSETVISDNDVKESDLYPMLTEFLKSEYGIYSKRIDEKRAKNKVRNSDKWLYPDLVALENLSEDWEKSTVEFAREYSGKKAKLWSFEVKIHLNMSNIRESFFQAVSNSSWANFGYLVAKEINDDAAKELRILSGLHGIGFIKIDENNPAESQIRIPAKEKVDIDWDTVNRLMKNKDFAKYIKAVKNFYQTDDVIQSQWDAKTPEDNN